MPRRKRLLDSLLAGAPRGNYKATVGPSRARVNPVTGGTRAPDFRRRRAARRSGG